MNNPIGIFDSGIGGVTVLKEIIKILPNENYIYYSDSIHNPYGEKSKEELISYVDEIMEFFIDRKCKAVVFACNTATALTINEMREKYKDIIIVGIEPAYKMVHDYASDKKTLVMATPATINSEKFKSLYNKFNNNNTVLYSCDGLAKLIENNNLSEIKKYLKEHLGQFNEIEIVVLGCTHYPLIKEYIQEVLGNVQFFDGSVGISKQLKKLLEEANLENLNKMLKTIEFIDSSKDELKEKRFFEILNNNYIS